MNAPESIAEIARAVVLDDLIESPTNPRKHFHEADIAELAESIKQYGVLQPILVRELDASEKMEIVAGHRRFMAAKKAGLTQIMATVRELTDEQVLEIQLIENIQRKDVHPLDEAFGFANLTQLTGWSVPEVCAKVCKSKSYVYQRMALLDLIEPAQKAFFDGELETSVALLIARIPKVLQKSALKTILSGFNGKPMGYQSAREIVQRQYMLQLQGAPFDTSDPNLTAAGACGSCPKRTGANRDLFGDIAASDLCTDSTCFDDKRAAQSLAIRERALAKKLDIFEGTKAKEVMPGGIYSLNRPYRALDEVAVHSEDGPDQTYRDLLGKNAPVSAIVQDQTAHGKGRFVEIVEEGVLAKALKKAGVLGKTGLGDELLVESELAKNKSSKQVESSDSDESDSESQEFYDSNEERVAVNRIFRSEIYSAIRSAFSARWEKPEQAIVEFRELTKNIFWQQADLMSCKAVHWFCDLWNVTLEGERGHDTDQYTDEELEPLVALIDRLDAVQLSLFLLDIVFIDEACDCTFDLNEGNALMKTANRLGVDSKKIMKFAQKSAQAKTTTKKKGAK